MQQQEMKAKDYTFEKIKAKKYGSKRPRQSRTRNSISELKRNRRNPTNWDSERLQANSTYNVFSNATQIWHIYHCHIKTVQSRYAILNLY
jgi:hypothetical protein